MADEMMASEELDNMGPGSESDGPLTLDQLREAIDDGQA